MGKFSIVGKAKNRGADNIDERLINILRTAAHRSPYDVQVFSGIRYGGGSSRHDHGKATDVVLVDPNTGQEIPNLGAGGEAFKAYEEFAQVAREVQKDRYPELNNEFRWGGYFSPSPLNPSGVDAMHFDLKPGAPMALGSWEGGLNSRGRQAVANLGAGRTFSATQKGPGVMPETRLAYGDGAPTPPIRPNGLDSLNEATRMAQGPEARPDLPSLFGDPAYYPNSDVPYAGGRPKPVQASFSPPPLPRPRPERDTPSRARMALNDMLGSDPSIDASNFSMGGYFSNMEAETDRLRNRDRSAPPKRSYSQQPMAPSLDRRPKPKPTYAHQQLAPSRPLPISKPEPLTYQVTNQGGAVQRLKGGPDPVLPHNVRPTVPPIPGASKSIVPPSTSNASRIIESYINTPLPGSGLASPAVPSMPSGLRANAPVPPMPPPGLQAGAPVPPMRPPGLGNMAAPMVAPPPMPRPRPSYTPNNSGNYVIRPGDTLSGIAAATGMSLANLRALNPNITDPNFIRAGDTLNTGGSSPSRTRTASVSRSKPRTTSQSRPRATSKPKNTNVFNRDTGRWFDAATNKWVYT